MLSRTSPTIEEERRPSSKARIELDANHRDRKKEKMVRTPARKRITR
jgi:hypothetical protein